MFIKIYPENPNPKSIRQVADCLRAGGVIIYPTDTIYGIACDINNSKAIEKLQRIIGNEKKISNLSFVCKDLGQLSDFTTPIPNTLYKMMRRALPGPYTFILNANNQVPKLIHGKKKTVGIRVPDNPITFSIIEEFGRPLLTASVKDDDDVIEYTTDPELIYERYEALIDLMVDGGFGDNTPSTIIDCTTEEYEVIREGKGSLDIL